MRRGLVSFFLEKAGGWSIEYLQWAGVVGEVHSHSDFDLSGGLEYFSIQINV